MHLGISLYEVHLGECIRNAEASRLGRAARECLRESERAVGR
jgi:hypothetical protein